MWNHRADALLRNGGVAAVIVMGVSLIADGLAGGLDPVLAQLHARSARISDAGVYIVWAAGTIGLLTAFAAAFWFTIWRSEHRASDWRTQLLLVVQAVIAFLANQELTYLMALELPLVLPLRAAFTWQGALTLLTIGTVSATGSLSPELFVPTGGLEHVPQVWRLVLTSGAMVAWQAVAFGCGCLATTERRTRRELTRLNAELTATRDLLAHDSRLAERLTIARELHDTLGHHLAALGLHLDLARRTATGVAVQPVGHAHTISQSMLSDVRRVVSSFREPLPFDLGASLRTMAAAIEQPAVHVSITDGLLVDNPVHAHVLFRAAQEGITNAIRHSGATHVWIELVRGHEGVELTIRDDGRGTESLSAGSGLRGMRERVEELRGSLTVTSGEGRGFALHVRMPAGTAP
jgi:two-component system, NarL family, sensor histidine kinase DesK